MKFRPAPRNVVRTAVLVVIVVCLSRENVWDITYRLLIVTLHGVWESLDSPMPTLSIRPSALLKLAKEGLFELVKK